MRLRPRIYMLDAWNLHIRCAKVLDRKNRPSELLLRALDSGAQRSACSKKTGQAEARPSRSARERGLDPLWRERHLPDACAGCVENCVGDRTSDDRDRGFAG